MKLTNEEKNILKILIINELDFYDTKEDIYQEDKEYIKKLETIIDKIMKGDK